MTDVAENMVLRTLYLPLEIDRRLKALAFTRAVSKGEVMRELINKGLATIAASGERSLADQLEDRLVQGRSDRLAEEREGAASPPTRRARAGSPAMGARRREAIAAG